MQPGPPGDDYPQGSWAPIERYENKSRTLSTNKPDGKIFDEAIDILS